jgi:hypothetical protein
MLFTGRIAGPLSQLRELFFFSCRSGTGLALMAITPGWPATARAASRGARAAGGAAGTGRRSELGAGRGHRPPETTVGVDAVARDLVRRSVTRLRVQRIDRQRSAGPRPLDRNNLPSVAHDIASLATPGASSVRRCAEAAVNRSRQARWRKRRTHCDVAACRHSRAGQPGMDRDQYPLRGRQSPGGLDARPDGLGSGAQCSRVPYGVFVGVQK